MNDVFAFRWPVACNGYVAITAAPVDDVNTPRVVIAPRTVAGNRDSGALEQPALFRTFTTLAGEQEIIRFADQFGLLGILNERSRRFDYANPDAAPNDDLLAIPFQGEQLTHWLAAIAQMRSAVELWELLEAQDVAAIARRVKHETTDRFPHWVYRKSGKDWSALGDPKSFSRPGAAGVDLRLVHRTLPALPGCDKADDVLPAASAFVRTWINVVLHGTVSPVIRYDAQEGKHALEHVPHCLLAALWLQFAQAITGQKKQRRCKECGGWFEVSRDKHGFTERRLFCSDACKSHDYRHRKERALQLNCAGKSAKEIAQELDTSINTIKKWLKS
jgi:hypothetical protein